MVKEIKKLRPMLAFQGTPTLFYPIWASPKIDGIRSLILANKAVSRTLKPFRNTALQSLWGTGELAGLDGEFIIGQGTHDTAFRDTTSIVMSHDKPIDDLRYYAFDVYNSPEIPYEARCDIAKSIIASSTNDDLRNRTHFIDSVLIHNHSELVAYEQWCLSLGYEGIMLRRPKSPYKYGRSSDREGFLLKVKQFEDSEAVIIDIMPGRINQNEATTNALGLTERSTKKDNYVEDDIVGKFLCKDLHGKFGDQILEIGRGILTHDEAREIYTNRHQYFGKIIKYKYFKLGDYTLPRFGNYQGFRDLDDI